MTKYTVIKDFTDLEDDNHVYRKGDKFPRKGRAKKERIEALTSKNNKRGEIVVETVSEAEE